MNDGLCFVRFLNPFAALQASPVEGPDPTLDEGLFHVLYGVSLSLSSVGNLLHSPWEATHEGDAQRTAGQLQVGSKPLIVFPAARCSTKSYTFSLDKTLP